MTQAALSTRLKDWLDGTHDAHGNPFATMADEIMLGSRLLDLANLFTSGSGTGAGMIPVLDSAGLYAGLNAETCLAEARTTLISKAVANVVPTAGGAITLTQAAMTVEAAAPDNVDSLSGGVLTSYGFLVTGTQAITYRDASVGGGNISTPRDSSLVTATGDIVMWVLTGTTYRLLPFMVQAGYPGGFLGPAVTADLLVMLATDQITNAVLIQAILNGAFQADAATRALFAAKCLTIDKITGTAAAANVPAAGVATLTGIGTYTMDDGVGAHNVDNLAGLDDGEWAWLTIGDPAHPVTLRDNAVGAGNIWTQRAASIVLATVADMVLVVRNGARYEVVAAIIQGGQPTGLDGTGATGTPSADNTGSANLQSLLPMPAPGAWAVDGDGANTNGGGFVGHAVVLTETATLETLVFDVGTGEYETIETNGGTWRTTNYAVLPDAPANDDAFMVMFDKPFPEMAFDVSATPATYTGVAGKWQVSDGAAGWVDVALLYDNSNAAVHTGTQPLAQDGAVVMAPEATWGADTYAGQTGYWARWVVTDATKITQVCQLNNKRAEIVTAEQGWAPPGNLNLEEVYFADHAATLHSATDVILLLWDQVSGESRSFTFAQDMRQEIVTAASPWALSGTARIATLVVQEDGTNEPTNALAGVYCSAGHVHGPGNHTHTGPSHSHLS